MDFDSFVLAASTADLADARAPAAREYADAIEFRMDLADEPLAALEAYDGDLPILATNRAAWDGGEWTGDEEPRLDALADATAVDAVAAIDVELAAIEDGTAAALLETARDRDVAVVASVHDFEGTPSLPSMIRTLTEASAHADVAKLAVTASTRRDALSLLSATVQVTDLGERVATMAMGAAGSHTRAVAPIYGSRIGYAPVDPTEATAPGQYDLETLATLVDRLGPVKRGN